MDIFLGAEIEGPASAKWFELQKEFSVSLNAIKEMDYGPTLRSIGIVSIIMRPQFFEDGGYTERRYYSRKKCEADIRLRLNYHDFTFSDYDARRGMYISHILEAVHIAGEKAGCDFDLEKLLFDIKHILK